MIDMLVYTSYNENANNLYIQVVVGLYDKK